MDPPHRVVDEHVKLAVADPLECSSNAIDGVESLTGEDAESRQVLALWRDAVRRGEEAETLTQSRWRGLLIDVADTRACCLEMSDERHTAVHRQGEVQTNERFADTCKSEEKE